MAYHARLSPSGAYRWSSCTASPKAQDGRPNKSNPDARRGTVCHQMCEEIMTKGVTAESFLGRTLVFWEHPDSDSYGESWVGEFDPDNVDIHHEFVVTQEMVDAVTRAVTFVQQIIDTQ